MKMTMKKLLEKLALNRLGIGVVSGIVAVVVLAVVAGGYLGNIRMSTLQQNYSASYKTLIEGTMSKPSDFKPGIKHTLTFNGRLSNKEPFGVSTTFYDNGTPVPTVCPGGVCSCDPLLAVDCVPGYYPKCENGKYVCLPNPSPTPTPCNPQQVCPNGAIAGCTADGQVICPTYTPTPTPTATPTSTPTTPYCGGPNYLPLPDGCVCQQTCALSTMTCARDGKTYCNTCIARQQGGGVAHAGVCTATNIHPTL